MTDASSSNNAHPHRLPIDLTNYHLSFSTEEARDGYPVIKMQTKSQKAAPDKQDKIYYLSSRYSPNKEAKRITQGHEAEQLDKANQAANIHIVVCLGGGNIALVEELLHHFTNAIIIVIDNQDFILKTIRRYLKPTERLHLLNEKNYLEESKKLFAHLPSRKVLFFYNRISIRLFNAFYQAAQQAIKEIYDKKSINIATLTRFEKLWLRNLSHNTLKIIQAAPWSLLQASLKDYPILVIGAGPSLACDLPLIKKHQANYFIIALDTTYKVLLHHKIEVDLLVTVDPQKINSQYLENVGESEHHKTIVVSEPAVSPKGIRHFSHLLMFDTIFPYYNYLKDFFGAKGSIDMGGSVATVAYEMLQLLQGSHATFSGLDFCYTNDQYHLAGTMYEEFWFSDLKKTHTFEMMTYKLFEYDNLMPAINVQDEPCFIDSKFTLFKNWFEGKLKSNQLSIYNSSQCAIPMENLSFLPFETFVEKYAATPLSKQEILNPLREKIIAHKTSVTSKQKKLFQDNLSLIKEAIQEHRAQAEIAYRSSDAILRKIKLRKNYSNERRQLETIDAYFNEPLIGKDMINIVLQDVLQQIEGNKKLKLSSVVDTDEEDTLSQDAKSYASSKLLYQAIIDSSQLNIRCFEKACRWLS